MGPTWVLSAPDRLHVGPMNLAIRIATDQLFQGPAHYYLITKISVHPCFCKFTKVAEVFGYHAMSYFSPWSEQNIKSLSACVHCRSSLQWLEAISILCLLDSARLQCRWTSLMQDQPWITILALSDLQLIISMTATWWCHDIEMHIV